MSTLFIHHHKKLSGDEESISLADMFEYQIFAEWRDLLSELAKTAAVMSSTYDCVVTNPPYQNPSDCGPEMKSYAQTFYPVSKKDMCTMFIEKCLEYSNHVGFVGMITMQAWMTATTYEKLRKKLSSNMSVVSMVHLGSRAFEDISGEVVQTTSWVMRCK
ncbi:MAG: Eco57I restriction-modification methylase domain-containing protein [Clostridium sp.]